MTGADWYVLEVWPQTELRFVDPESSAEVRVMLTLRALEGLMTRVPIEMRTRQSVGPHNRPIVKSYPVALLPGYVFVGSKSPIRWAIVKDVKEVRGVLMADGKPARLSDADVAAVDRLCKEKHVGGRLQVGATGRIRRGPFRDLEAVIRAIRPDLVRVSVHVFGAEREISVTADNIESV